MNTVESIPAFLEWNVYKGDTEKLNIILRDESNKEWICLITNLRGR